MHMVLPIGLILVYLYNYSSTIVTESLKYGRRMDLKNTTRVFTLVICFLCLIQSMAAMAETSCDSIEDFLTDKSEIVAEKSSSNITDDIFDEGLRIDDSKIKDDVFVSEKPVSLEDAPFNVIINSDNSLGVEFSFSYNEKLDFNDIVSVYLYKYIETETEDTLNIETRKNQTTDDMNLIYSKEIRSDNTRFFVEDKVAATKYNLTVIHENIDARTEYFCDIIVYNPEAIKKNIEQKKDAAKQCYGDKKEHEIEPFGLANNENINVDKNSKVPKQDFSFSIYIVSFTYIKNATDGVRASGTIYETENNNSLSSANQIYDDYDVRGYLSSNSDVDWFKVTYSTSGPTNFYLGNLSENVDYSISIYDYSNTLLYYLTNNQGDHTYVQKLNMYVYAGYTYYFKIEKRFPDNYPSNYIQYLFRTRRVTENTTFTPHDSYEWNDYYDRAYQLFTAGSSTGIQSRTYYANIHTDNRLDCDCYKIVFNQDVVVQVQLNDLTGIDSILSLFADDNGPPLFQEYQEEYEDEYDDYIWASTRLEAGTYYIVVEKTTPTTQNYQLKVRWEDLIIDEYEPNDSFSTATQISKGSIYSATWHWHDDVDYYKYTADITSKHFITLDAPESFESYITVYDSNHNQIGQKTVSDNNNILYIDFNNNNIYYIKISHFSGYNIEYDLKCDGDDYGNSFGFATQIYLNTEVSGRIDFGGDNDYFKFIPSQDGLYTFYTTGSLDTYGYLYNGSQSLLKSNDDSGSGNNFKIVYRLNSGNVYYIRVRAYGTTTTGSYTLWAVQGDDHPDNFNDTPKTLYLNSSVSGVLDDSSDVDCFKFTPSTSGTYKIYTTGSTNTAGILFDTDKTTSLCTSYNAPGTTNFRLARTLQANKTYYIRVASEISGGSGAYSIVAKRISNPADNEFSNQWNLQNVGQTIGGSVGTLGLDINVLPVWEYTTGDEVTIGIIDTGISVSHTDLTDNISTDINGYNFVYENNDLWPTGAENHGTHVAGIAGATSNSVGISGVAPDADLVSLTLVDVPNDPTAPANNSQMDAFIDAIEYCVDNNIGIVNCSFWMPNELGSPEASYVELRQNIANADDILFVVAAGNRGTDISNITNNYRPMTFNTWNMINVAAVDNTGALWSYSNYGTNVHVAAPGVDILSTIPTNTYDYMDGTSMAAPHVAGVAALLKSYYPNLTVTELKNRIISANNVTYRSSLSGSVTSNGILNAWYALTNDSTHPRSAICGDEENRSEELNNNRFNTYEYTGELETNVKELINNSLRNNLRNIQDNSQIKKVGTNNTLTNRIYVNIDDGVDKDSLIKSITPKARKIKEIQLTGSIMLEYDTIEEAVDAVLLFNSYDQIRYAEPLYNVKIVPS